MDINTLKKRGFQALGEQLWKDADDIFSSILAQNPEDAECYLGKLMAEFHISTRKALKDSNNAVSKKPIPESNKNYMEACRLNPQIAEELKSANATIEKINQKNDLYTKAASIYRNAKSVEDYQKAAEIFKSLGEESNYYSDCIEKIECWHIRWDAGPLEEKDINYTTLGCKISDGDAAKILEAYKESKNVVDRFLYYRATIESRRIKHRASWIAKLFGAKDKVIEEKVKVEKGKTIKFKEPIGTIGNITMMEEITTIKVVDLFGKVKEIYKLNWYEAMAYVLMLNRNNFAGFSDWKLPTIDELQQIHDGSDWGIYVNNGSRFWSASTQSDCTALGFCTFYNHYGTNVYNKLDRNDVRCVR